MIVRWTKKAVEHLGAVHAYIADSNLDAANLIAEKIVESVEQLIYHPQMGRKGRVKNTRELVIPQTRLIIVYRLHKDCVEILAALHAARKWPDLF